MTTSGKKGEKRAGQGEEGAAGVDTETGELSPAALEAQRELDAFIGRVAAGGGQAAGQGGKRRKSKQRRSGGLSPLARRLLRMFVAFRAFQIFPLLALCFIGGGRSSSRQSAHRRSRKRVRLSESGEGIVIQSDYDADWIAGVRDLPGRRFDGGTKCWSVPRSSAGALLELIRSQGDRLSVSGLGVLERSRAKKKGR